MIVSTKVVTAGAGNVNEPFIFQIIESKTVSDDTWVSFMSRMRKLGELMLPQGRYSLAMATPPNIEPRMAKKI